MSRIDLSHLHWVVIPIFLKQKSKQNILAYTGYINDYFFVDKRPVNVNTIVVVGWFGIIQVITYHWIVGAGMLTLGLISQML